MATATALLEDACDTGVACLQNRDLLVVIAQALAESLDMTATELLEAACTSGIACLGERDILIAIAEGINQGGGGGGASQIVAYTTTDPITDGVLPPDQTKPAIAVKPFGTTYVWTTPAGPWDV